MPNDNELSGMAIEWWNQQAAVFIDRKIPEGKIHALVNDLTGLLDCTLDQAFEFARQAGVVAEATSPPSVPAPPDQRRDQPKRQEPTTTDGDRKGDGMNNVADMTAKEVVKYFYLKANGSPKEIVRLAAEAGREIGIASINTAKWQLTNKDGWKPPKLTGEAPQANPPKGGGPKKPAPLKDGVAVKGAPGRKAKPSNLDVLIEKLTAEVGVAEKALEEIRTKLAAAQVTKSMLDESRE